MMERFLMQMLQMNLCYTEDKVCHNKNKVLSSAARGMVYANLSSVCKIAETWAGLICDVIPVFVCVSLVCVVCVCLEVDQDSLAWCTAKGSDSSI